MTLGSSAAAEGLISQPLATCFGPYWTVNSAAGLNMSTTSPTTFPTTSGSRFRAMPARRCSRAETYQKNPHQTNYQLVCARLRVPPCDLLAMDYVLGSETEPELIYTSQNHAVAGNTNNFLAGARRCGSRSTRSTSKANMTRSQSTTIMWR